MGKAAMCIRMLQYLNTGRIYKVSELAGLLGTNPRNVVEYKKELDEVASENNYDFYIENIPGRYGGYRINGEAIIPSLGLSPIEKNSLTEALNYLLARNDFLMKKEYHQATSKILSSLIAREIEKDDLMVINRYPLVMSEKELKERSDLIKKAIKEKKKIIFEYLSNKNAVKEHTFDPYELFMYNNAWYVIGWLDSKTHSDICWFKINRIKSIKIMDKKYTIWKNYNRNNYIDDFGFKTNGEWYHVEFIAYGTYASLCKERIYGKNQVVESIDENSTRVKVDMQNKENIIVFLMGFNKYIKVIEPQEIKEEIINRLEILKENCK